MPALCHRPIHHRVTERFLVLHIHSKATKGPKMLKKLLADFGRTVDALIQLKLIKKR